MRTFSKTGWLVATTLIILQGCQTLGIQSPKTFNERLAAGYVTVTTVRQLGTTLVTSGKLSSPDAQNVQTQADNARNGLDIAQNLGPLKGEDKLTSTLTVLQALQSYLTIKGK